MIEERVPPQNIEAEQAVLGAMLIDKEAIAKATEVLSADDFYREAHRVIFSAMLELYNKNEAVDMVTVTEILKRDNKLEDIGGIAYITSLANVVLTAANVKYHAEIVAEKSVLRQLVRVSTEIAAMGYEANEDVGTLLETAESRILEISNRKKKTDFTAINDVLMDSVQSIESLLQNKGGLTGLPAGFADLDKLTSGLHPSDFIILAARPSMGKTAFVLNIAQYVAFHENMCTAIFSLEMSKEQLVNRLFSLESKVDAQALRTGNLSDADWEKLVEGAGIIGDSELIIDDTPGISISELRSKCRKYKLEHDLKLVIIDYLQLMTGSGRGSESRQQEISDISRSLKTMALELGVPVIALSQLSRSAEKRESNQPMLADLRESGSLEQDADMVLFINRKDYYEKAKDFTIEVKEDGGIVKKVIANAEITARLKVIKSQKAAKANT